MGAHTYMLDRKSEGAHKATVVMKYYVDRSMLGVGMQAESCLLCLAYISLISVIDYSGAVHVRVGARCCSESTDVAASVA